jgi:hypothetical protein
VSHIRDEVLSCLRVFLDSPIGQRHVYPYKYEYKDFYGI